MQWMKAYNNFTLKFILYNNFVHGMIFILLSFSVQFFIAIEFWKIYSSEKIMPFCRVIYSECFKAMGPVTKFIHHDKFDTTLPVTLTETSYNSFCYD